RRGALGRLQRLAGPACRQRLPQEGQDLLLQGGRRGAAFRGPGQLCRHWGAPQQLGATYAPHELHISQWTSNNKFRNIPAMQKQWFQDRLRRLGKTQRGLAKHMGLDPSRVTEIFNRSRGIKIEEAVEMADYLETTLYDLVGKLGSAVS